MHKFLIILLLSGVIHAEPQPLRDFREQNTPIENANRHLQSNYCLKLFKNLVLTGIIVEDRDRLLQHRTYTDLKIEF